MTTYALHFPPYIPVTLKEHYFSDVPAPTAGDDGKALTYRHSLTDYVYTSFEAAGAAAAAAAGAATALATHAGVTSGVHGIAAFGATLNATASQAAAQTALGLVIGTNVQAQNANLAAIAGLTTAANKVEYWTGAGAVALADFTSYGRGLVASANVAATGLLAADGSVTGATGQAQTFTNGAKFGASPPSEQIVNVYGGITTTTDGTTIYYRDVLIKEFSTATGTLKIVAPKGWTNTMLRITIRGFNYARSKSAWTLEIGGYAFLGSSEWINASAQIVGPAPFESVRLGYDGSHVVILLGTTATVWTLSSIAITDVVATFSSRTGWGTGWSASIISSEAGITGIVTPSTSKYGQFPILIPTSVPASTDNTLNSLIVVDATFGNIHARFGVLDASGSSAGYPAYIQGGNFLGADYNLLLQPRAGRVGIGTNLLPTALMDIAASATDRASLRIRSGVRPTVTAGNPNDGEIWYDGTHVYMRIAGADKQLDN